MIWGNNDIVFNGEPLMFSHWSRNWLLFVKEILENGKSNHDEIYNRLQNKASYIFEMQTIKTCWSQGNFHIANLDKDKP